MIKRFRGLFLAAILIPVIAFSGCELFEKEKDNSQNMLLLFSGINSTGTVTTESYGEFASSGFGDPGSGIYQQSALNGSKAIVILLSGGHAIGSYDQDHVDITYNDGSYTWVTVTGQIFSLTITSWPGAGGFAQGSFGGQVERLDNPGYHMPLGGTFNVKITN